jgi:hypothetical protein
VLIRKNHHRPEKKGAECECDGEVSNGLQGDAELGYDGLHQQGIGGDDAVIRGQRSRVLDSLKAGGDDVG